MSKAAGAGVAYGGAAGSGGAAICALQLVGQPLQRVQRVCGDCALQPLQRVQRVVCGAQPAAG